MSNLDEKSTETEESGNVPPITVIDDEVIVIESDDTPGQSDGLQSIELNISTADGIESVKNVEKFVTFEDAGLYPQVLECITKLGWTKPTPVQSLCLPYSTVGRDVAGFAQTGTGKTGVFLITAAQRLLAAREASAGAKRKTDAAYPKCIVLAPTRELAVQIDQDAEGFFKLMGISHMAVYGGTDWDKQASQLREGIDVIIATPGRLKDYFQKKVVAMDEVCVFVCDEADRMFDMGFISDVEFFLDKIPEKTQKLLFSATTNPEVKELAFEYLNKPAYISVNPEVITPERIDQRVVICEATNKLRVMLGLLRDHNPECSIIFTNTKLTAEWLLFKLVNNGVDADLITGDLPQKKRINLIQRIKEGKVKALIATDVASRGLHISRVTHVYNFDLPDEPANYVHRIGRTARAGASGSAISLVCEDYGQNLAPIKELLGESSPLKAEWFDEEYLKIEDKAGNPFADMIKRAASGGGRPERNDRPGQSDRGGPRGDRHGGSGRDDRPNRSGGGGRNDGRQERGRPHGSDRDQGRGNQGAGRNAGQQSGGRNQQGGGQRPGRHQKELHPRHSQFPSRASAGLQVQTASAPTGFVGLIKRLFSVIFGKK